MDYLRILRSWNWVSSNLFSTNYLYRDSCGTSSNLRALLRIFNSKISLWRSYFCPPFAVRSIYPKFMLSYLLKEFLFKSMLLSSETVSISRSQREERISFSDFRSFKVYSSIPAAETCSLFDVVCLMQSWSSHLMELYCAKNSSTSYIIADWVTSSSSSSYFNSASIYFSACRISSSVARTRSSISRKILD